MLVLVLSPRDDITGRRMPTHRAGVSVGLLLGAASCAALLSCRCSMLVSFIVGMLVGAALLQFVPPLWSQLPLPRTPRILALGAAALATLALAAGTLYLALGSRFAAASRTAQVVPAHAVEGAAAKSMETEVTALEARLARQGGSPEDWSLLAQGYDFLGRPDDAQRARAHQGNPAAGADLLHMTPGTLAAALEAAGKGVPLNVAAPPAASPPSARELEQRVAANPRDSQGWLALAEARRTLRNYPAARDAYVQLVQLNAMTAQS